MKLHLPKLLLVAVLSCSMAQAEDVVQDGVYEITTKGTTTIIEGNLTANFIRIDVDSITGASKNSTLIVEGDTVINSDRDCPRGADGNYDSNYLEEKSKIQTESFTIAFDTAHAFAAGFTIRGTIQTDSFIASATDKRVKEQGILNGVSLLTGGRLESLSSDKGIVEIHQNVKFSVGGVSEGNIGTVSNMETVIDGGTLIVDKYAAMDDITLINGSVEIKTVDDEDKGRVLGDITVKGGTMSLNNANITSKIEMISGEGGTSGTLNILGDVKTGALTLNSGTINVGAIDEEGNNVVSHLTAEVTMTGGIINVGTDSTISSLMVNGATLSDVSGCTVTMDTGVEVKGGEVTVDGGELTGTVSDSKLTMQADGEIAATISGTSSVKVNSGTTTISGKNNKYSGGTVINGATLILESGATVGTGTIELTSTDTICGVFDMGDNALTNELIVTGCTIRNAKNYKGDMEVSHKLVVEGVATAKKVTLIGAGTLVRDEVQGGSMTTDEVDVQTDGNAGLDVDLTINDNGTVTLNNGKVLSVMGSLTLGEGVSLRLSDDDYGVGDTLLSSTGTLTMGDVTLVYNDSTVELELQGNSLVLVSKFKQDKADAVAQGNWGIASASRAFVNTVRGQHSNTGCIANGRGTVWAAAFGAYNDMDGADINVKGAAVGVDTKVGSCSTVGLAVGYADGEVSPTGLRDVDQEGTYVALYGEHGLKKLSSTSCLSLDWVAAYGNTESEWNGMDWEQDSLQLNTRLNWNKKVTDRLCMSVFGGLEYFASESDTVNGVKTGSIQNLRGEIGVGARYVAWGTSGSEAVTDEKGATIAAARPGCEKLVLHGEIRYMNDMVRSNPVIRMNGLSGRGENPGRQGMGIEAGATYRIGERWSASSNYGFNAMEDSKEHRVNVGASYTF